VTTKAGQRLLNLAIISAIALSTAALTVRAYAETTANLTVSAEINTSCTISSTDLSFGTYDGIVAHASQDLTDTATISTTCTNGSIVVITMGRGQYGRIDGPVFRQMKNEGSNSYLEYQIYSDAGHRNVWSNRWNRMKWTARVSGTGFSQDRTVYGKVFKNQQDAAAGSYTDTVSIEVIY
tara:strand:+ start:8950 stop:9489 length:540 start_codon:yes stop_codon:yes gene_type:complete